MISSILNKDVHTRAGGVPVTFSREVHLKHTIAAFLTPSHKVVNSSDSPRSPCAGRDQITCMVAEVQHIVTSVEWIPGTAPSKPFDQ